MSRVSRPRLPRGPRVPETQVQWQCVTLYRSMGARVYVIGTKRRQGDYQGTMQSPGVADLLIFLPPLSAGATRKVQLWHEVKAELGRLSDDQKLFRADCAASDQAHIVGGIDAAYEFLINGGWLDAKNVPHYRRPKEQTDGSIHGTGRGTD